MVVVESITYNRVCVCKSEKTKKNESFDNLKTIVYGCNASLRICVFKSIVQIVHNINGVYVCKQSGGDRLEWNRGSVEEKKANKETNLDKLLIG